MSLKGTISEMKMKKLIAVGLILLLLVGCTLQMEPNPVEEPGMEAELLVSAAASLANSLDEIGDLFELHHDGISVTYNYSSSGALQHQIEQGAPVDIFLSAGRKQMDMLIEKGYIDHANSVNLLSNELVVIVPEADGQSWGDLSSLTLSEVQTIAIGEPLTVPAGEYAEAALVAGGAWDSVKHKLVYGKDVRQVLFYVETGNVDAGIVYNSDALSSSKVRIVYRFDSEDHEPIAYPIGIVNHSRNDQAALLYYEFLQSIEVLEMFGKYGFTIENE